MKYKKNDIFFTNFIGNFKKSLLISTTFLFLAQEAKGMDRDEREEQENVSNIKAHDDREVSKNSGQGFEFGELLIDGILCSKNQEGHFEHNTRAGKVVFKIENSSSASNISLSLPITFSYEWDKKPFRETLTASLTLEKPSVILTNLPPFDKEKIGPEYFENYLKELKKLSFVAPIKCIWNADQSVDFDNGGNWRPVLSFSKICPLEFHRLETSHSQEAQCTRLVITYGFTDFSSCAEKEVYLIHHTVEKEPLADIYYCNGDQLQSVTIACYKTPPRLLPLKSYRLSIKSQENAWKVMQSPQNLSEKYFHIKWKDYPPSQYIYSDGDGNYLLAVLQNVGFSETNEKGERMDHGVREERLILKKTPHVLLLSDQPGTLNPHGFQRGFYKLEKQKKVEDKLCQKWKEESAVQRSIDFIFKGDLPAFSFEKAVSDDLWSLLNGFQTLDNLFVRVNAVAFNETVFDSSVVTLLKTLTNFNSLKIFAEKVRIDSEDSLLLKMVKVKDNPDLTALDLRESPENLKNDSTFLQDLVSHTNLKEIRIKEFIIEPSDKNKNLKQRLISKLRGLKTLKTPNFSGNAEDVLTVLKENKTSLTSLDLHDDRSLINIIINQSLPLAKYADLVVARVKELNNLKIIDIRGNFLSDRQTLEMAKAFTDLQELQTVKLSMHYPLSPQLERQVDLYRQSNYSSWALAVVYVCLVGDVVAYPLSLTIECLTQLPGIRSFTYRETYNNLAKITKLNRLKLRLSGLYKCPDWTRQEFNKCRIAAGLLTIPIKFDPQDNS